MTTSEPTTGEIVRALRCIADNAECKDCRYKYPVGNVILCDHEQMNGNAADRLESQERDLETLRAFHERYAEQTSKQYVVAVCGLTARAEQAEQERDLAVNALTVYEDALFDECDKSYQSGYMDGYTQRGEQDDED